MTRRQLLAFCVLASPFWTFELFSVISLGVPDADLLIALLRGPARASLLAGLLAVIWARFRGLGDIRLRWPLLALAGPLLLDLAIGYALSLGRR